MVLNGATYQDATKQDFNHYFANTAMAFKLSPTKKRLFIVAGVDGVSITGTYLTREEEFKSKTIPFKNWWDHLDPIMNSTLMFNTTGGCGIWVCKGAKNTRKSFPWNTGQIRFHGTIDPKHKTAQHIGRCAFSDLYGTPQVLPPLSYVLHTKPPASITRERYTVDNVTNTFWFYNECIGSMKNGNTILLPKRLDFFKDYLLRRGILDEQVTVVDDVVVPQKTEPADQVIPMAQNPNWIAGYHPGAYPTGYSVMYGSIAGSENPKIRTYKGYYPGGQFLMPGWTLYNTWGQGA